jgi:GT2 family glycosyltransferase
LRDAEQTKVNFLVYIVIVNWNGKALLDKCLGSLYAYTPKTQCEVIVVDNASTDGSAAMVQQNYPQVEIIKNAVNTGFSVANNQGIRQALAEGAKQVLLLNNDVEVTSEGWLDEFFSVLESDSKIGIAGCKLLYPDGSIQHVGGVITLQTPFHRAEHQPDRGQYDRIELVDYVTGAALMIKAEVIRHIGLLDEGYSPLYYEDTDWCVRTKLYGYNIAYTPKPTLTHHCGASSSKLGDQKKRFYSCRSFIRFLLLNYPALGIARWLLLFESKEILRCFVAKPRSGKLPLTLNPDAANKLRFQISVWWFSIRKLKEILFLRRQRFIFGRKLRV